MLGHQDDYGHDGFDDVANVLQDAPPSEPMTTDQMMGVLLEQFGKFGEKLAQIEAQTSSLPHPDPPMARLLLYEGTSQPTNANGLKNNVKPDASPSGLAVSKSRLPDWIRKRVRPDAPQRNAADEPQSSSTSFNLRSMRRRQPRPPVSKAHFNFAATVDILYTIEQRNLTASRKPWYILLPESDSVLFWDLAFSSTALLFTAVVTPFEVAFMDPNSPDGPWALFVLNRLVDLIFTVDIIISFLPRSKISRVRASTACPNGSSIGD
jgi:hypothetical protein